MPTQKHCLLQAEHFERVPARQPKHAMPQFPLSAASRAALADRGISQLFSHQAQAIDAVISGGLSLLQCALMSRMMLLGMMVTAL